MLLVILVITNTTSSQSRGALKQHDCGALAVETSTQSIAILNSNADNFTYASTVNSSHDRVARSQRCLKTACKGNSEQTNSSCNAYNEAAPLGPAANFSDVSKESSRVRSGNKRRRSRKQCRPQAWCSAYPVHGVPVALPVDRTEDFSRRGTGFSAEQTMAGTFAPLSILGSPTFCRSGQGPGEVDVATGSTVSPSDHGVTTFCYAHRPLDPVQPVTTCQDHLQRCSPDTMRSGRSDAVFTVKRDLVTGGMDAYMASQHRLALRSPLKKFMLPLISPQSNEEPFSSLAHEAHVTSKSKASDSDVLPMSILLQSSEAPGSTILKCSSTTNLTQTSQNASNLGVSGSATPERAAFRLLFSPQARAAKIDKPNVYAAPAQLEVKEFETVKSRLAYDYGYGVALVPWTLDEWLKHKSDLAEYEIRICKRKLAHKELTAIASAKQRASLAALTQDQREMMVREEEARARLVAGYRTCANEDHRTTVLAQQFIWSGHSTDQSGGRCWPSKSEFIHEGPDRLLNGPHFSRRMPVPRNFDPSDCQMVWRLSPPIMQQEVDVVNSHFYHHRERPLLGGYGDEVDLCLSKDLRIAISEDL